MFPILCVRLLSKSINPNMCTVLEVSADMWLGNLLFCRIFSSVDYHSQFIFWLLLLHFITIYM